MSTIAKLIGFPEEICEYIGYLYLQECFSDEQCYKYHTSILRREHLKKINFIYPRNMSVHTMIKQTLYEHDFKSILPRHYLHADPFQIYLCGSLNYFSLEKPNKLTICQRIYKMNSILSKDNYYIYRKLTKKAIDEGYYSKNMRKKIWKVE